MRPSGPWMHYGITVGRSIALGARTVGIWCCLPLGGCRRHWKGDLGGGLPVLPDFYPIYNHQEWLGRSVLPRIGDRDIHGDIGLRNILRQADDLELRIVRLKHDRARSADVV